MIRILLRSLLNAILTLTSMIVISALCSYALQNRIIIVQNLISLLAGGALLAFMLYLQTKALNLTRKSLAIHLALSIIFIFLLFFGSCHALSIHEN